MWSSFHELSSGLGTYSQFQLSSFCALETFPLPVSLITAFAVPFSLWNSCYSQVYPLCLTTCLFLFISLPFHPWSCSLYLLQCLVCYLQRSSWVLTQLLWFLSLCCISCSQISASLLWYFLLSWSFPESPGILLRIWIRYSDVFFKILCNSKYFWFSPQGGSFLRTLGRGDV